MPQHILENLGTKNKNQGNKGGRICRVCNRVLATNDTDEIKYRTDAGTQASVCLNDILTIANGCTPGLMLRAAKNYDNIKKGKNMSIDFLKTLGLKEILTNVFLNLEEQKTVYPSLSKEEKKKRLRIINNLKIFCKKTNLQSVSDNFITVKELV
jgi:hypothetical protein